MSVSCCEMCALEGKLSKFIFYTLVPLSSTRGQLRKMATSGKHKSFYVLDFHVNKSVVSIQRHFRTKFGTDPSSGESIRKWHLQFQDTGCICKWKSTGCPSTEEEAVERVCTSFVRSPWKSTYRASQELGILHKTVWWVLWKHVFLYHHFQRHWLTYACRSQQPSQWLTTMLQRVWQELDYRLDVCRVMGGAHFEHL
jgi:hypothetical protein